MKKILTVVVLLGLFALVGCFGEKKEAQTAKENTFQSIMAYMQSVTEKRVVGVPRNGVYVMVDGVVEYYSVKFYTTTTATVRQLLIEKLKTATANGKTACFVVSGMALPYSELLNYTGPASFNVVAKSLVPATTVVTDYETKVTTNADGSPANTAVDEATAAVVKAEGSKLQADVTSANALVVALPADVAPKTTKADLLTRLGIVQKAIDDAIVAEALAKAITDATAAVLKAEGSKLPADVTSANALVVALPADVAPKTTKADLLTRLEIVQKAIDDANAAAVAAQKITDATAAVVKAEGSKLPADVTSANALVVALPADVAPKTTKADLLTRLEIVQKAIDDETTAQEVAEKAVLAYETGAIGTSAEIMIAEGKKVAAVTAVAIVTNVAKKTDFEVRIADRAEAIENAKVILVNDAKVLVELAEVSNLQADLNTAQTAVTALPAGTDKEELQARLNALQAKITPYEIVKVTTNGAATFLDAYYLVELAIKNTSVSSITATSGGIATSFAVVSGKVVMALTVVAGTKKVTFIAKDVNGNTLFTTAEIDLTVTVLPPAELAIQVISTAIIDKTPMFTTITVSVKVNNVNVKTLSAVVKGKTDSINNVSLGIKEYTFVFSSADIVGALEMVLTAKDATGTKVGDTVTVVLTGL